MNDGELVTPQIKTVESFGEPEFKVSHSIRAKHAVIVDEQALRNFARLCERHGLDVKWEVVKTGNRKAKLQSIEQVLTLRNSTSDQIESLTVWARNDAFEP